MQIVIDMPEDVIECAKSSPNYYPTYHFEKIWKAIVNGIPLPKGHGRLIDADALDEAIKHCEEVAKELEEEVVKGCCDDSEIMDKCLECAKEHRQLAEWLRALKEIWDSGDCNNCLHQNNCTIRPKPGQLARFNCYQYERRDTE